MIRDEPDADCPTLRAEHEQLPEGARSASTRS
jgi:hypothetical protein